MGHSEIHKLLVLGPAGHTILEYGADFMNEQGLMILNMADFETAHQFYENNRCLQHPKRPLLSLLP